jgi:hypothetical protein
MRGSNLHFGWTYHKQTLQDAAANFVYVLVYAQAESIKKTNTILVDVAGIEPVTPCCKARVTSI